jgi:hypothetical protein
METARMEPVAIGNNDTPVDAQSYQIFLVSVQSLVL